MEEKLAFYKQKWFMWLALILFAPLGVFLMWKYEKFDKRKSIILTNVFLIWFFVFFIPIGIGIQVNNATQARIQEQKLIENNKNAAQDVDKKITALGDPKLITLEKANDVKSARAAYDSLSSDQQYYVENVVLLTTIEKTITDLQTKKAADEKAAADKAAADKLAAEQAAAKKAADEQASAKTTQSATMAQTTTEAVGTTVYITTSGKKYHLDGCSSLSKSKIPIDLDKAKAQGYGPCSNCDPPQ